MKNDPSAGTHERWRRQVQDDRPIAHPAVISGTTVSMLKMKKRWNEILLDNIGDHGYISEHKYINDRK